MNKDNTTTDMVLGRFTGLKPRQRTMGNEEMLSVEAISQPQGRAHQLSIQHQMIRIRIDRITNKELYLFLGTHTRMCMCETTVKERT